MEYLSDDDLERYREILERTNAKFEEFSSLEKSHERCLSDLSLCRLLGTGHFRRLSRLDVKLFADPLDAFSLYGDVVPREALGLLRRGGRCRCLLVEIDFSGALARHLRGRGWYVSVSVSSRSGTVTLISDSRRFVDLLPIDADSEVVTVSSTLHVPILDTWIGLELEDVEVDASYRISTAHVDAPTSSFCLYPSYEDFLQVFFENCHQNVDPGVFVQLENGSRGEFEFALIGFPEDKLVLRKDRRVCVRSSNAVGLYLLKLYLNKAFGERSVMNEECDAFKEISRVRTLQVGNAQDAEVMYTAVRELWCGIFKPK